MTTFCRRVAVAAGANGCGGYGAMEPRNRAQGWPQHPHRRAGRQEDGWVGAWPRL